MDVAYITEFDVAWDMGLRREVLARAPAGRASRALGRPRYPGSGSQFCAETATALLKLLADEALV